MPEEVSCYVCQLPSRDMSRSRSQVDSSSSLTSNNTTSVPSSYFQSEYPSSGSSDIPHFTVDEISSALSHVDISSKRSSDSGRKELRNSSQKKVSISIQADRSIVGQEDSSSKERKRWVRPPVVGQASTSEQNVGLSVDHGQGSSESEAEIKAHMSRNNSFLESSTSDQYQKKKDYVNDKPLEGGCESFSDASELQRVPTPSSISSVTSRPLEWDSGADVGYFAQYGSTSRPDTELSTIERLALDQGRASNLIRSDPEGTSSKKLNTTVIKMIGIPTSESTPVVVNSLKIGSNSERRYDDSKCNPKPKYQHLFPEVIIQDKGGNQSDTSVDCNPPKVCSESASLPKKFSSSLENVNDDKPQEIQNATFPRSQSQLNLCKEPCYTMNSHLQNVIGIPQSVSSSSVATVVTGTPKRFSKFVQTSNVNNTDMIQCNAVSDVDNVYRRSQNNNDHVDTSTLESIQMSAVDRVNSFEYLPGHVYENAQMPEESNLWENTEGISLKSDVDRGVQLLEQFIQGSNANNTLRKKQLIQRVVKKIINTDYPEDESDNVPLRCSTRRSQNRDQVIGESSSEHSHTNKNRPLTVSSSLSGQSFSTWPSTTESTKSSEPSKPKSTEGKPASKATVFEERSKPNLQTESSSDQGKSNWRAPISRAEKVYEKTRKGRAADVHSDDQLLEFFNSEREIQLDWIVKEINHLSNLKVLLEKHERLKKNLNKLKRAKLRGTTITEADDKRSGHSKSYGFRRKPLHSTDFSMKPSTNFPTVTKKSDTWKEEENWDSHNYAAGDCGKLRKSVSTETRREDIFGRKLSTAYTITFEPNHRRKKIQEENEKCFIADRQTLAKESREYVRETYQLPSLQDYLIAKRPEIVQRAEMRRKTVAELGAVRQMREEKRPAVLAAAISSETACVLPRPPPTLVKRVVSQKEMRNQTEKKYRQTFEVKKKVSNQKLQEKLKTNRLMADIYNKRLQLLTLKGQTNLSNSIDVITTV